MSVLMRLVSLYESQGLTISSGLDIRLSGNTKTEFTFLLDEHDSLTNHLGIALKEVYFLECLIQGLRSDKGRPLTMFGIGNGFGWSTLAAGLSSPDMTIRVLELAEEQFNQEWIHRTNLLGRMTGSDIKVLQGCSPEDVPSAMESLKVPAENQGVDLIFIDGEHTNAQVTKDIDAVMPYLAPDGAIMLHDVVAFSMVDAVKAACTTHGLTASLLPSTNSGILLLHPQPLGETTALACRAFGHHRWSFNMLSHFRKGETILDLPPEVFGPLNPLDP